MYPSVFEVPLTAEQLRIQIECEYNRVKRGEAIPMSERNGERARFWAQIRKTLGIKRWEFWRNEVHEASRMLENRTLKEKGLEFLGTKV